MSNSSESDSDDSEMYDPEMYDPAAPNFGNSRYYAAFARMYHETTSGNDSSSVDSGDSLEMIDSIIHKLQVSEKKISKLPEFSKLQNVSISRNIGNARGVQSASKHHGGQL